MASSYPLATAPATAFHRRDTVDLPRHVSSRSSVQESNRWGFWCLPQFGDIIHAPIDCVRCSDRPLVAKRQSPADRYQTMLPSRFLFPVANDGYLTGTLDPLEADRADETFHLVLGRRVNRPFLPLHGKDRGRTPNSNEDIVLERPATVPNASLLSDLLADSQAAAFHMKNDTVEPMHPGAGFRHRPQEHPASTHSCNRSRSPAHNASGSQCTFQKGRADVAGRDLGEMEIELVQARQFSLCEAVRLRLKTKATTRRRSDAEISSNKENEQALKASCLRFPAFSSSAI